MNEVQQEFLDILAQVRTHLEFRRALGVRDVALPGPAAGAPVAPSPSVQTAKPAPSVAPPRTEGGLDKVREELGDCKRCALSASRTSIVFGEGDPGAALVFVGEGPGAEEDRQARPFVGAAGQLLTDIIEKGMLLKRREVYICNIVKCRPPENRTPEEAEIAACAPFLEKQLLAISPRVIVALGNTAARALLGTNEGITTLRGRWKEWHGIPLMPTFHPAYLLRNPGDKKLVWQDIKQVMEKMGMGRTNSK